MDYGGGACPLDDDRLKAVSDALSTVDTALASCFCKLGKKHPGLSGEMIIAGEAEAVRGRLPNRVLPAWPDLWLLFHQ